MRGAFFFLMIGCRSPKNFETLVNSNDKSNNKAYKIGKKKKKKTLLTQNNIN